MIDQIVIGLRFVSRNGEPHFDDVRNDTMSQIIETDLTCC